MTPTLPVSVVIPAIDESASLPSAIARCRSGGTAEVIVADGGSRDDSVLVARRAGARVVMSDPGRGTQCNAGAAAARHETLLFLHADTTLPTGSAREVGTLLDEDDVVAGAFRLTIDGPARALRVVERAVNMRSTTFQRPYGDQGLFLRRTRFEEIGGYLDIPVMEDYEIMRRLRRLGTIAISPKPVLTSARRWMSRGALATTLVNQTCVVGFHLGVDPARLARWRDSFGSESNRQSDPAVQRAMPDHER